MNSSLVPMEPAITAVRNVMGKLTAETSLMKTIAVSNVYRVYRVCGGSFILAGYTISSRICVQ